MKLSALLRGRGRFNATAIEYGLIAAGIAIAIIVMVNTLSTSLGRNTPTKMAPINQTK
jgi:hypothetical protein